MGSSMKFGPNIVCSPPKPPVQRSPPDLHTLDRSFPDITDLPRLDFL